MLTNLSSPKSIMLLDEDDNNGEEEEPDELRS
jgi:hypothetical protein